MKKSLFDKHETHEETPVPAICDPIPDVEITEAEYRTNPLAADVKYWGHWVLACVEAEVRRFYPPDPDGQVPVAYLWARTVSCPNPSCRATVPLVRSLWLCKKANRKTALRMECNAIAKKCVFSVTEGRHIDFDPDKATMLKGSAVCPFCQSVIGGEALRTESKAGRMSQQQLAVMSTPR